MTRVRAAIAVAALAAATLAATALAATTVNLPALLAHQIARARAGGVAVLIPATLTADTPVSTLHGSAVATKRGYDIQLAYAPSCDDATACFLAEFSGKPGGITVSRTVTLARGIRGGFHGISCGASCAPATIEWKESGVRYTIQWRAGSRASMIALANSAILGGPR